ncbi:DgyrCDS5358 [Dimorphilus gyrociliatus]|uniref:DgyrCDS5358 n=1 Tax=Dimorphilus gyrociliatus TaxID=2664684 RepID=A0A7I8VJM2_9ANNE|nr:DgyrCDS5358 [Dimorphilus gyrociliatus]
MYYRVQFCIKEFFGLILFLFILRVNAKDLCQLCECHTNSIDCSNRNLNRIPSPSNGRLIGQKNSLNISYNRIEDFEILASKSFSNITHLSIKGNSIQTIPESLLKLKQIQQLDLAENSLKRLPIFNFEHLVYLNLSHNHIHFLDGEILQPLHDLEILDLSYNELEFVSKDSFLAVTAGSKYLKRLKRLALNNNRIRTILPQSFMTLSGLEALNIAGNTITDIKSKTFYKLVNLRFLNLDHNEIANFSPDELIKMEKLKYLYLGHNKLSSIPSKLPLSIEWLDISHNTLETVDEKSHKADLLPIDVLLLSHNPFRCDCKILWLKELFDRRKWALKYLSDFDAAEMLPTCKYPSHLAKEFWNDLTDNVFDCVSLKDETDNASQENKDFEFVESPILKFGVAEVKDTSAKVHWKMSKLRKDVRRISLVYRQFGYKVQLQQVESVMADKQEFILTDLLPSSSYVVCAIDSQLEWNDARETDKQCVELTTTSLRLRHPFQAVIEFATRSFFAFAFFFAVLFVSAILIMLVFGGKDSKHHDD